MTDTYDEYEETEVWITDESDPWTNLSSGEELYFLSARVEDITGVFYVRLPMLTWDQVTEQVSQMEQSTTIHQMDIYSEKTLSRSIDPDDRTLRERLFGKLYDTCNNYVWHTKDDIEEHREKETQDA